MRLPFTSSLLSLTLAAFAGGTPIVDLGYVRYRGVASHEYPSTVAYLGVPYAEPPIGDLRFRAPVALDEARVRSEAGGMVVPALEYPNFCVQGAVSWIPSDEGGAGSEDCLKVNVYAPVNATAKSKLPVLVYFHAGGFFIGNPAAWPFEHWVHQSPSVVVVSVYYRLGSLGFLSHPAFDRKHHLGDLNAGFLDQVEALRWVRRHINAFGGDRDRVTISGHSAGGSSVEYHLVAARGKGEGGRLFHGAIAQSVDRAPMPRAEQVVPVFDLFVNATGCTGGDLAAQMACIRAIDVKIIAQANLAVITSNLPYRLFHPVLDSTLFTDYPTLLLTEGQFLNVPVLVGSTSNETASGGTSIRAALASYFPALSDVDLDAFVNLYERKGVSSGADVFRTATGESEIRCTATIIGSALSEVNKKVWTYRYNEPVPTGGSDVVEHTAENWMMFRGTTIGGAGTFTLSPMTSPQTKFASSLIAYWLSFVRTGDPNTFRLEGSPVWEAYSRRSRARMVLQQGTKDGKGSYVEREPGDETRRCEFVAGKAEGQQN